MISPSDISAARPEDQREVLELVWFRLTWQDDGLPTPRQQRFRRLIKSEAYLDAAMMMVPGGHFWSITMRGENRGGFHACCAAEGYLEWIDGATPALALCAAILHAQSKGHEHE